MKLSGVNLHCYNTSFAQKTNKEQKRLKDSEKLALATLGFGAVGFCGAILYKNNNVAKACLDHVISDTDKSFHQNIVKSLKKTGINVELDALKSIVGPEEFSKLIKKFKPEHFRAGEQISEAKAVNMSLGEFYKNTVDGNFRVSLHTHSNFSDGKATVEEFLECARKYADKVAGMNKNDGLPPFTIALTDHDNMEGCIEIIKLIAKNPEKYKNLKFVAGCEFSVKNGDKHHDITGLALNPFDKVLSKELLDLSIRRRNVIQSFLDKQPKFNGKKVTYADLVEFEKQYYTKRGKGAKHSIENCSGIVCVRHGIKFFYKYTNQPVNKEILNQLGDKEILPIETVLNGIKQNGGFASLTHPVKSFWRYIGDEELDKLVKLGVKGIEVNHQYTPSKISQVGKNNNNHGEADNIFNKITEQYKQYADKNGLFLSGGTDSHEKQVFSRQPVITNEFLNEKILK